MFGNTQGQSQRKSDAGQYLPRGQTYQNGIATIRYNPRGDMPISEWMRKWEEDWERLGGEGGSAGELHCILGHVFADKLRQISEV